MRNSVFYCNTSSRGKNNLFGIREFEQWEVPDPVPDYPLSNANGNMREGTIFFLQSRIFDVNEALRCSKLCATLPFLHTYLIR